MSRRDFVRTILTGILFGAVALGAAAALAWTGPQGNTPPNCPTTIQGCNVPINTGSTAQTKSGGLTLGGGLTAGSVSASSYSKNGYLLYGYAGEWYYNGGCGGPNPFTGACTCPPGTTATPSVVIGGTTFATCYL